jgi:hypothetical protein
MENGIFNQIVNAFLNYKGVGFVSLQYRSKESNELSKCLYNVGAKYQNAVKSDIDTLNEGVEYIASDKYTKADWDLALAESMKSLVAPDKVRSDGQKNAYVSLNEENNSLKLNYSTLDIYLFMKQESKVVLEQGVYKEVNSKAKTIAKNVIKKNLKSAKFRTLILKNVAGSVKVNKQIINVDGVDREEEVVEVVVFE